MSDQQICNLYATHTAISAYLHAHIIIWCLQSKQTLITSFPWVRPTGSDRVLYHELNCTTSAMLLNKQGVHRYSLAVDGSIKEYQAATE